MKNAIKIITPLFLMLLFAVSSNAQTAGTKANDGKQCDPKACDIKKCADKKQCNPSLCNLLMPQCSKSTKTVMAANAEVSGKETRVAAASAERTAEGLPSSKKCTATEGKKCCAKKKN